MFNIIKNLGEVIGDNYKPLKSLDKKIPNKTYLYPSSSMCYTNTGAPLGACLKQVWLYNKGYPISNPDEPYNRMAAEAGIIWESWLVDQYIKIGIYKDRHVKLVDNDLHTSCELDILHTNPETSSLEVTEVKTYSAANWYASKEILGYKEVLPKPKDAHLLQVVKYLMILKRYGITHVNLIYLDRSGGNFYNNKQFYVYLDDKTVMYDTYYKGSLHTITETRFNTDSLKEKDDAIIKLLDLDFIPHPDYKISYTPQDVENRYKEGLVTKTNHDKYLKGQLLPEDMSDWQCRFCKFGKNKDTGQSTCIDTVQLE